MDANGKELSNLMKEVMSILAPLRKPRSPSLVKLEREYEEADALDHLHDGFANICDAWWSLNEAMKRSVYFEEDEVDVEQMRDTLSKIQKDLQKILERRGVL